MAKGIRMEPKNAAQPDRKLIGSILAGSGPQVNKKSLQKAKHLLFVQVLYSIDIWENDAYV